MPPEMQSRLRKIRNVLTAGRALGADDRAVLIHFLDENLKPRKRGRRPDATVPDVENSKELIGLRVIEHYLESHGPNGNGGSVARAQEQTADELGVSLNTCRKYYERVRKRYPPLNFTRNTPLAQRTFIQGVCRNLARDLMGISASAGIKWLPRPERAKEWFEDMEDIFS